jgi:polysaccharide export outer membrane protein
MIRSVPTRIVVIAATVGLLGGQPGGAQAPPPAPNQPPTAVIRSPADRSFFIVGRTVSLSATATDDHDAPEALTYRWKIDLVYQDRVVSEAFTETGPSVSFRVDDLDQEAGFSLKVRLVVTDREGLNGTAAVTIFPRLDQEPTYPLGPGDILSISVYAGGERQEEFRTEVSAAGTITGPLIGDLAVSGSTAIEVAERLTAFYGRDFYVNPQVLVAVEEHAKKVFVSGEVQKPGSYSIKDGATLLSACILAGGFTDFAALNRVVLTRTIGDSTAVLTVDVGKVQKGKAKDLALETGDRIQVPHKRF